MRARAITIALLAVGSLALAGCNPDDATTASSTAPPAGTTVPTVTSAVGTTPTTGPVPSLVGKGLQAAQDAAQNAGFYNLIIHDSAGRNRHQILDRDWKVCSQTPKAGSAAPADTPIDLGAVKLDESCPTTDQKPPAKAGATMPNFVGKALNTATAALPSDTSISPSDASGQGRMILVESNWKVCSQSRPRVRRCRGSRCRSRR